VKKAFIFCILVSLLAAPSLKANTIENEVTPNIHGIEDLHGISPVGWLNHLKLRQSPIYTFWNPIKGWIQPKDLPALLSLIDSKETCASVCLSASNYATTKNSTIGQEALFMLGGLRKGEYPPALNSMIYEVDRKDLIAWARSQLKQK
jgi:hypothetical protein